MIDRDATLVIDSFTMSGWMAQWFRARFPGQILDAGPLAPVGHGVGMAIGAQLARPGKQVVLVIGDGGLGVSGFDLETARRYDLPIVAVLWNNSSWGPSFEEMPFLKGRTDPFDMLPDQRYDRMFEAMGCHGEHVERPEQFRPALERALARREDGADQRDRRPPHRASEPRRQSARLDPRLKRSMHFFRPRG